MPQRICFILFVVFLYNSCKSSRSARSSNIDPYNYTIRKKILAENGAVVSAHPLASKVGTWILQSGGTAVDAAIATQLTLAVVYPVAGNLGGGGFTVARLSDGRQIAIDYREMAPLQSHRDMYLDSAGNALLEKSQSGHLSSGVPGSVAGIFAFYKYASLPFKQLIQPAIDLAEKGFVITAREAGSLNSVQEELIQYNTILPVFVKPGGWKAGDTLIQKDLAKTLARIRDKGMNGFYEGETAQLLVEEMKRGGGIIQKEDLQKYVAKERAPHTFTYRGYHIVSMPMPSSGGLLLNQMMKMVEHRGLASLGFHSVKAVHLMTEVERRAFADRGEYMGDADFFKVPVKSLSDTVYLKDRMKDFDPAAASSSTEIRPGIVSIQESEETTHLSVMDKEGNAVAITTTLNDGYGSRVVVGGGGFFLNDEMDDFSIKPGVPNMYGAIGGIANSIAPGKRMLSSMTPTIVLKDNFPFIITGTPGGTTIPTSVFQTLVNLLDFGISPEQAVYSPKFHHQWLPDTLYIERDFPVAINDSLRLMGHNLLARNPIGRIELIFVRKKNGKIIIEGVADIRGDDGAEGY